MNDLAKMLLIGGGLLIAAGVAVLLFGKIPGIGKLPSDFYWRKGQFTFYFPLATCLVISLVLTFLFNLFGKK